MDSSDCVYDVKLCIDTSGINEAQKKADKLRDTLAEVHELIHKLSINYSG